MDINLFTGRMKLVFLQNSQVVAAPADVDPFTTEIPSTARIENYPWMYPPPRLSRYLGKRRWGFTGQIKYMVPNLPFDAGFVVEGRDVEDDQVNGYAMQIAKMTLDGGAPFKSRTILGNLANADAIIGFDGSNFIGTSHTLGGFGTTPPGFSGGGNALTFTSANAADGNTYRFYILIHGAGENPVKPMLFQRRKPLEFVTDAGTPQAKIADKNHYLMHLEAAPAFGYWWDCIRMTITNFPSLIDIFTCIDACRQMFRRFTLPRNLPTDPLQRVHEQLTFRPEVATIVSDTYLEQLLNHAMGEERVGVNVAGSTGGLTNNIYYRKFNLLTSAWLDTH